MRLDEIDGNAAQFGQLRVVDAHHHLWDLSRNQYPWLADPVPGTAEATITEHYAQYDVRAYLDDLWQIPVVASIHVQAEWDSASPVAETRWLHEVYTDTGWPTAVVGAVHLESPDAREILLGHSRYPAVRGVRDLLGWAPDEHMRAARSPHQMTDRAWRRGFALLEQFDLSFDLHVYPSQMREAAELARAFPRTPIILNHCGSPDEIGPDQTTWRDGLQMLADCSNVSVKLSGISHTNRSIEQIQEYIVEVLDVFGCDRAMFGSNLPIEHIGGSLNMFVSAFEVAMSERTDNERDSVWGQTAARVYRLGSTKGAIA